jgi:hypothetical protein
MQKISRRMGTLFLIATGLAIAACGSSPEATEASTGQLALPLSTQGASGVTYRLRHATFVIRSSSLSYEAAAGAGNDAGLVTVNSDDQPDAQSLTVSLEQGSYDVQLLPGWTFEKDGPGGPEPVTATLLSGADQWVWVAPHSTSFAEYQFGLGDRAIWFNGKLNIDITVYETPSQYFGGAGDTGVGGGGGIGMGGAPSF